MKHRCEHWDMKEMSCMCYYEGLIKRLLPSVGWRTWLGLFWWDGGGAILFYIRPKPVYRARGNSHGIWHYIPTLSQLKSTHPETEAHFWSTEYTQQAETRLFVVIYFSTSAAVALTAFSLAHFLRCKILWMEDKCCRRLTAVVLCFSSSFWQ